MLELLLQILIHAAHVGQTVNSEGLHLSFISYSNDDKQKFGENFVWKTFCNARDGRPNMRWKDRTDSSGWLTCEDVL
jgi:hypothetical protein